MRKLDIAKKFTTLKRRAEKLNSETFGMRRLYPMQEFESDGKLKAFGVYDYQTKKYVFADIRDLNVIDTINELERFIERME